jgi:septal ring factor EnvC (AmiA/AmiB activator)
MRKIQLALLLATLPLAAQAEDTAESRMRDALRQTVTEMRAAQDAFAQAQSDLAKANADKAALQTQLDAATAKLSQQTAAPAAKPADTAALEQQVRTAQAAAAQYQALSSKLQGSYQSAAEQVRQKDEESRAAVAQAKATVAALETCKSTNTKLIDVSEQILHLYETQSFRAVWLKSYEPILGQAKVRLENMVQDYDDKIHDQEYLQKPARPH